MSLYQFKSGDKVVYVPSWANGDKHHPSCERGFVKAVGIYGTIVFVKITEGVNAGREFPFRDGEVLHD